MVTGRRASTLWSAMVAVVGAGVGVALLVIGVLTAVRGPAPARLAGRTPVDGQPPPTFGFGAAPEPSVTPVGHGTIVFASQRVDGRYHIHLIGENGTGDIALTSGRADERGPARSPDGTRIAFTRRAGSVEAPAGSDLYVMNADGSEVRRLTASKGFEEDPSWSPDGSRIAFSALNRTTGLARISVVAADGSGVTALAPPPEGCSDQEPAWSPDGLTIAFSRKCVGTSSGLYLMKPDGTGAARLTEVGRTPDWSPDGSRIAYTGPGSYGPAVFIIGADGTDRLKLTKDYSGDPVWSPDGARIVFTRSELSLSLYVINADGTDPHRLTDGEANAVSPSW